MRKNLRYLTLSAVGAILISAISAQDRFAYVITDVNQNTAGWSVLRKLNLQTGIFSDALLNGLSANELVFDATSKKQIQANATDGPNNAFAFNTGVAALAYDKRNSRIYFTPMFIDQLRYIDLKTMKIYYVTDQSLAGEKNLHNDESKIVSRMVITPDGYGYAITNDATNFVRFTTGKKLTIEQLGSLVDDPSNTGISVHNRCSSWGGDIVADDEGKLYMFSASNSIFKIDPGTKVATWLGTIKGLPAGFTTNGIVVTDDGNLLAGSQGYAKNWYVVDPKSWSAAEYKSPNGIYLTSDLANSNVLSTRKRTQTEIAIIQQAESLPSNAVQLYPNPISISNNQFKLQFNRLTPGDYRLELTDVTGKQVMLQKLNIANDGQVQTINLRKNTAQGIYLVKLTDINNRSVFSQKLVVQ